MKKNTKLAYFLRGLGMGIVFTTVVVSFGTNTKVTENVVKEELTDEEIIEKAKEIGMVEGVDMKLDSILDDSEQSTEVEQNEESQEAEQTPAPEAEKTEEAEETEKTEETVETEEANEAEEAETKVSYQSFTVKSGENATSVARRLKEAGLVDDADEFKQFLDDKGYSRILIAGKHQIIVDGSYAAIAKELSTNR